MTRRGEHGRTVAAPRRRLDDGSAGCRGLDAGRVRGYTFVRSRELGTVTDRLTNGV